MYEHRLARDLGMTIETLITGKPTPLSTREFARWQAFYAWEHRVQKAAAKKAGG